MKCDDAQALFLAYHDGDLSKEEERELTAHLKKCKNCTTEWDAYLATVEEVSGMYAIDPPADFAERVKGTIGRRSKGRFFGDQRSLSVSFAIVSFVLIVLVLLAYLYTAADPEITVFAPVDTESQK